MFFLVIFDREKDEAEAILFLLSSNKINLFNFTFRI